MSANVMSGRVTSNEYRVKTRRSLLAALTILCLVFHTSFVSAQTLLDSTHSAIRIDSLGAIQNIKWNGVRLGFDHILSIYEWFGRFDYSSISTPAVAGFAPQRNDTIHLNADTRFLEGNSLTTTEATGLISASQPLGQNTPIEPFLTFYGNSYATSTLPGTASASLITRQVDGFGIAGLRSRLPATNIDLSLGGGVARQSQPDLSAYGAIVRGDFSAPAELLSENTLLEASALVDERSFQERNERYSNDRASVRAISNFGVPSSPSSLAMLGMNTAMLNLGLFRRDFFFSPDSTNAPVKQERTEYSMLLADSLNYPFMDDRSSGNHLAGDIDVEFEPHSIVRRSDIASNLFTTGSYSALSSLLVPNEVSSLRLATSGRLDFYKDAPAPGLGKGLGAQQGGAFAAEARMSYEESSQNVSLLSNEIVGVDPAFVTKLSETLDEASFSSRTTLAGLSMRYSPSVRDSFQLESNARLLNYDTPSLNNDDDHDELITSAGLGYNRIFSTDLNGGLELRAGQTHLVYLKSDRSAQNNVTRSIDLASKATYAGSSFFGQVHGEVFANYTVLDYLDSLPILQSVGNYVIRGMILTDSLLVPLGLRPFAAAGPLAIENGAELRISERGSYEQNGFTERRDTRITELSASLLLDLSSIGSTFSPSYAPWSIRAGVRGFFLSRYGRSDLSIEAQQTFSELERQTRIGPYALVSLARRGGSGPVLSGSVWYAVIHSQTFDIPSYTRTPQLESHLQVQWTF